MKNKDYWSKRSEDIAIRQYRTTDDYINAMKLQYLEAENSIRKDIEVFYKRFAINNNISLSEARKLLNSNQLSEFKMTLKEFRQKAKSNPELWDQELNNVYYKTRITRLQALQAQVKANINNLYSKEKIEGNNTLKDIYKDTYYRNIFEIHKGLGVGVNFAKIDDNAIDKVMKEKWLEGNYSSRVWSNRNKLIMELQTNLMQAFIRGDSIDKTAKIIADRMNVATNRAITLVTTESSYITTQATFNGYVGSGIIKEYEILATLDAHTSKICRSMDGKVFNVSEKIIGVNAPPFHSRCRTTIMPYFDDAIDEERIARGDEGYNYTIDGNMKFDEWYSKYVE